MNIPNDRASRIQRATLVRAFGVCVNDTNKLRAWNLAPYADVVPAKLAGPDDSNANGPVSHNFLFGGRFSGEARRVLLLSRRLDLQFPHRPRLE